MNTILYDNENTDGFLRFAGRDQSRLSPRPAILLIKVGLIIILCEATTISVLNLLDIKSVWGSVLDPLLLTVFGTICLYRFIVSPMNRILKIKEKAESELELYRGLMDKLNDAIFIADPGTAKILDVNYRACTTLGYSRTELLNLTVLDIDETFPDISAWAELIRQAGSSGYEFLPCRHKRKDGTTFPVEMNANLINWGGRDYMVAMVRDITKREQAQIRLKESETKFRKLAECARDAIIVMGPKGEISFWNPAAEKIFGYPAGEVIGKNLHEMLVPERFRDAFYKGFSGFQKTGKGNAVGKTLNLMAIRKGGSEFSIEVSISPVRLEGILHAVGIVRDTSQKTAVETDLAVQCNTAEETAKSTN
jgi:PAS domain S-box-containing protein